MRRTTYIAALLGLACVPLVATAFGWRFALHAPVVVQPAPFDREFVFISPCPPTAPLVPLICETPVVVSPVVPTVAYNETPGVQSAIYQGPTEGGSATKAVSPEMMPMPKKEAGTPKTAPAVPATPVEATPTPAAPAPKKTESPLETKKSDSIPVPSPAVTANPVPASPVAPASVAPATPAATPPTPDKNTTPLKLDLPPLPIIDKSKEASKPADATKPIEIPKPVETPIAEPKLPAAPAKPLIEPSISRYRHENIARLGVKLFPVDGKPTGDQYTIGFYNYSPRSVELHVNEQTIVLKPQHSVSVSVLKVFQYRLDNGQSESVTIPGESAGYEVVIKSSDGE